MVESRTGSERLIVEHEMAKVKLRELKANGVALVAVDYDGTVYERSDPRYNLQEVFKLASEVRSRGVEFAIISGRNTTLELPLRQSLIQYSKDTGASLSIWRSGGNGMNLSKITSASKGIDILPVYTNFLAREDIQRSLSAYLGLKIDPDIPSQEFFRSFLQQDLPEDLVPRSFFELSKPFNGNVFAEAVKISFVLPTSAEDQRKCILSLRESLEPHGLVVGWGGTPFADISRKSDVDGKLFAVQNIIKKIGTNISHVGTFGDAPNGNDAGLLSLSYSFTNNQEVTKDKTDMPPFIINIKNSPIGAVHEAILHLIAS
jgi:hydroxymethylpyrimidine pyrophosphatase-like HAD family hydrolase